MRISLSTGTFYHRGLDYNLRLARDAGCDGVEYVIGPDYFRRGAAPLVRGVATVGLPVLSVHPPFARLAKLPFVPWPRRIIHSFPLVTALAHELGASLAVTHTIFLLSERSIRGERYRQALRLGRAAGGGMTVGIESNQYNKRRRRYLLDDLPTLVDFAQRHECGITFDTCHAGANGQDILTCYDIVRPALRNVHLSDVIWRDGCKGRQGWNAEPRTHILPGAGDLPLDRFLARLAADQYEGLITLEIHPLQVSQFSTTHATRQLGRAVAFVREAVAAGAPASTRGKLEA
jgi:sugar phosphate isomerase/epimerase